MREEKFSNDTRKSKTSRDASAEAVFLKWGDERRSRPWQRKAAGKQGHLLARLGFGEGTSHGRARTGETGLLRESAQRQRGALAGRNTEADAALGTAARGTKGVFRLEPPAEGRPGGRGKQKQDSNDERPTAATSGSSESHSQRGSAGAAP